MANQNCEHCGTLVYVMERVSVEGKSFHKACFEVAVPITPPPLCLNKTTSAPEVRASVPMHMHSVPAMLASVVDWLSRDMDEMPEWQLDVLQDLKTTLQKRIRDHVHSSAETRRRLSTVPTCMWQEENRMFRLTETPHKVLGLLPKQELARLDDLCKLMVSAQVYECRSQLKAMTKEMPRLPAVIDGELSELLTRHDLTLQDLKDHKAAIETLKRLYERMQATKRSERSEAFLEGIGLTSPFQGQRQKGVVFAMAQAFFGRDEDLDEDDFDVNECDEDDVEAEDVCSVACAYFA